MGSGAGISPPGGAVALEPGPATLPADLTHRTVMRTSGGGVFAGGWADDTPGAGRPEVGAERQEDGE